MNDCQGCRARRRWIKLFIIEPLQRTLRRISGSETTLQHHDRILSRVMEAGASLEADAQNLERVTNVMIMQLAQRVSWLEQQNTQLREKVKLISEGENE